jgi:CsoR family transcriptional regulator, copper-sensing transcriptional repressor
MADSIPSAGAPGGPAGRDQLLRRLARVEGQVRGVKGMIEQDRYCIDVLQQITAIQAALDKVAIGLVQDHVRTCVIDAGPETREQKLGELMGAFGRLAGRR